MASKKSKKSTTIKRTLAAKKNSDSLSPAENALQTTVKHTLFTNEPDPLIIEPIQPLIQTPVQRETGLLDAIGPSLDNEFDQADLLVLRDDRLRSNLDLYAKMVGRTYQGIDISQKGDLVNPRELDDNEQGMLTTAANLDNILNFKQLFESYTKALIKYGDVIEHIETDPAFLDEEFDEDVEAADAVTALTPLPMNQMTIIDEAGRIDEPEPEKVITQANIYVVDEENADQTEEDPVSYDKEEIMHVSLDPRHNWKEDLVGRNTFGIWSDAPLKSIIYLIEWKHNLIRNDMIWRNKMLPREHHKLNMAAFAPENYPGASFADRLGAAKIAATLEMNKYALSIRTQQPDQGYVTSDDVEIIIIEPKTANYHQPNEQINQIDTKISSMTGTPEALSGGEQKGFSSIEFSGTFVSIRAEEMAETIARSLDRVVWKHLVAVHPSVKIADIKRVHIKTRLILDRDLSERAKVISVLGDTKIFTPTELRELFGKEALTTREQEEINEFLQAQVEMQVVATNIKEIQGDGTAATKGNLQKTTGDNPTGNQQSKQKRLNENNTTGERRGEKR